MRKTLILILIVTILSVGTFGYAAAQLLPLRDQVQILESTKYGDSRTAEGLTARFLMDADGALHWDTKIQLGADPEITTDYTFTLPPQEEDHRREKDRNVSLSATIWGTPELEAYDYDAGEKVPEAYVDMIEDLEPGQSTSRTIYMNEYREFFDIQGRIQFPNNEEITLYADPEETGTVRSQLMEHFEQEFRIKIPDSLKVRLGVTYSDRYYNYICNYEPVQHDGAYSLDVKYTFSDHGCWFTFNTSHANYDVPRLNTTQFPDGYGIWCIPYDENGVKPELNLVHQLDPAVKILDLRTSNDGKKILLSTMDKGTILLTVLDADTAELLQQLTLTEAPGKEGNKEWCFYEADGCMVLAMIDTVTREKELILFTENDQGQYDLLWNLPLNDDNSPVVYFHSPSELRYEYTHNYWPVMAWNGKKLAFAMAYQPSSFDVAVYEETGLTYHGHYETSLQNNFCAPAAFDPLSIIWN